MAEARDNGSVVARDPGTGATEHVIAALTQAIRDNAYQAGERLVENRLTEQLGVSRSSVREALRRLEAHGLVQIEPHRGAVVRRIGPTEVMEILAVREVLEGLAASLAAQHVDQHDNRQRLEAALDRIDRVRSGELSVNYLEDNLDFHAIITELSDNPTLRQQINQLQLPVSRSQFFSQMKPEDWIRSLNEHELILVAILEGDAALAEQQMRAHIRRTIRLIKQPENE